MMELFERWRATRSKPITETRTVMINLLDRPWTAFVEHWNTETGAEFVRTLEHQERQHGRLSVSMLAYYVCELSWQADRTCCFVHFEDGCPR
ncbi:hypothetical protein PHMEG_00010136 [Phytophthora megakarya]|uniref:Uncharacterized protein n=1 Tax=Phytophthora megakarya TaxID=4795 RepID=A0A225WES6_9STRA|nr:hypothetical protein PHMEG_00010136 [Phytophthora megakarya]